MEGVPPWGRIEAVARCTPHTDAVQSKELRELRREGAEEVRGFEWLEVEVDGQTLEIRCLPGEGAIHGGPVDTRMIEVVFNVPPLDADLA